MGRPIVIIGVGNMGQALTKGLFDSPLQKNLELSIFDIHPARLTDLHAKNCQLIQELRSFTFSDQLVILCVKPQDLKKVAADIGGRLTPKNVVLTILAGTHMDTVARELNFNGPMVRAMSNIPAVIRLAATAMCGNAAATAGDRQQCQEIFEAVGEVYWTSEELLDTVTGLSGSGPAYVYMVIEALTDGGVKMGLPRELAAKLSAQTVLGAASLVKASGMHPAVLRDQVATPAGTTISALHELEAHGLRNMFVSAVVAATERAKAIGKSLNT